MGRLRRLHRGVYGTGPVTPRYQREAAALFACGDEAVLSYHTASALWGLTPAPPRNAPVDVTSTRHVRGPRQGVRFHRVCRLDRDEIDHRHGLPVTTPARTLLDIGCCIDSVELERALARAERSRVVMRDDVEAVLARYPRRRGAMALRVVLRAPGGPTLTRSEAEARFLRLIRRGAVASPKGNVMVEGVEVDFAWRTERLVVEIDGYAHHADRAAFERDRRRDGVLTAAGFRVIRFTWRQLDREPEAVLVRLAQALALGRRDRGLR
jgi:very-short-patch-repair endonuclease